MTFRDFRRSAYPGFILALFGWPVLAVVYYLKGSR